MDKYNRISWDKFFYYDETSPTCLRWKVNRYAGRNGSLLINLAGDVAGYILDSGYYATKLDSKNYCVHRIIWSLFFGTIDTNLKIDHVDGNRSNNCISNMRLVDCTTNNRNASMRKDNKTGVVGVGLDIKGNRYTAHWYDINGKFKQKYFSILRLGEKLAFQMACECREQSIDELNANGAGYTDRHGT